MVIKMGSERKWLNSICNALTTNYYVFVVILYFCTFFKSGLAVGLYSAILMIVLGIFMLLCTRIKKNVLVIDVFVMFYVIYCLCTVFSYFANNMSIIVFVKAASNSLLPLIFYWSAKRGVHTIYKAFWWGNGLCCTMGIALLIVMPTWYFLYCQEYGYSFTRLSSCVGSTAIGSMCAIAVVIAVQIMYSTNGKKGKLQYIVSILFAFASMQRSAWIVVILTLVLAHVYIFFKWRCIAWRYLVIEGVALVIAVVLLKEQIISMVMRWIAEHQAAANAGYSTGMFSSRTDTWGKALQDSNILFGNGYGTAGHKAIGYTDSIVADGSWICLLCEIGIVGMLLFVIILFYVIVKGIKNLKSLFMPLGIIVCILLQAIGSNLFEYQLIMPIFWYAIGHIASYEKEGRELKNENIRNVFATIS